MTNYHFFYAIPDAGQVGVPIRPIENENRMHMRENLLFPGPESLL